MLSLSSSDNIFIKSANLTTHPSTFYVFDAWVVYNSNHQSRLEIEAFLKEKNETSKQFWNLLDPLTSPYASKLDFVCIWKSGNITQAKLSIHDLHIIISCNYPENETLTFYEKEPVTEVVLFDHKNNITINIPLLLIEAPPSSYLSVCLSTIFYTTEDDNEIKKINIDEFVQYHLEIGITHFFAHDRDGSYQSLFEPYVQQGILTYKVWPLYDDTLNDGIKKNYIDQVLQYNNCVKRNKHFTKWISSYLKENEDKKQVSVRRLLFGGIKNEHKGLSIEKWTHREDILQEKQNWWRIQYKTIANAQLTPQMRVHDAEWGGGYTPPVSVMQINHYSYGKDRCGVGRCFVNDTGIMDDYAEKVRKRMLALEGF